MILPYDDARHGAPVVDLWNRAFGYTAAHNAPEVTIDTKRAVADGLFFVCERQARVAGTAMAGWDGHRGWLYSIAVDPSLRRQGIATRLVRHAEEALAQRGCPKINLQIVADNAQVVAFYESLGYAVEPRISMGKRLFT
jgi:ribosomal protein S18 acetylase RimI-like enzyme